jgi:predicted outer membrane repeat protein
MALFAEIVDTKSTYTENVSASNGAAMTISDGGTYTGTDVNFTTNKAKVDGGAIYIRYSSVFKCTL